jgi:hypothetical protein
MEDSDPPRPESHPAGYDEGSPYEGEDLSTYPDWWRQSIEEFREFEMRPYRPPRFADGALVPAVIGALESKLDAEISLRGIDPDVDDDWGIWVDDKYVAPITRERLGEGYTEYHETKPGFQSLVETAVESE